MKKKLTDEQMKGLRLLDFTEQILRDLGAKEKAPEILNSIQSFWLNLDKEYEVKNKKL